MEALGIGDCHGGGGDEIEAEDEANDPQTGGRQSER